jgi:hypothetical protein
MKVEKEIEAVALRAIRERTQTLALVAKNPNYFGNLLDSPVAAVTKIIANTFYEDLTCVGYNSRLQALEATIDIRRATGYLGGLCTAGSIEYVRFYIDYGAGWEDLGLGGFRAHDVPDSTDCAKDGTKPLSVVVTHRFTPKRRRCTTPVTPKVRAILSWQVQPPANQPNWRPVWGDVLDRTVHIEKRQLFFADIVSDIGQLNKLQLVQPPELIPIQELPIPLPEPAPLALAALAKQYATIKDPKLAVEPHRFGHAHLLQAISTGVSNSTVSSMATEWKGIGLDFGAAIDAVISSSGNTTYEQLHCLGLDDARHLVAGTFTIKRPSGFNGNNCSSGSLEHVAFWADWDDDCTWTYLGTASVAVHDINAIPADGLSFSVVLPVDVEKWRRPCRTPRIVRLRGVLSWNSAPSTTDPNDVPYWGNRIDAHAVLRPSAVVDPLTPRITEIGGIGVAQIDVASTGRTQPAAFFAQYPWATADGWGLGRACPFGGYLNLIAPPILGFKYRLTARRAGAPLTEIVLAEPVSIEDQFGVSTDHLASAAGFFTYVGPLQNMHNTIYNRWNTSGLNGLHEIRLDVATMGETVISSTPWLRIDLDNTTPEAFLTVDGGECIDVKAGTNVTGRFVARDTNFGGFSLSTSPNTPTTPSNQPTTATPSTSMTAPTPGDPWTLSTTAPVAMRPCGYVVSVIAYDRTIVNSFPSSHNHKTYEVGLCLRG